MNTKSIHPYRKTYHPPGSWVSLLPLYSSLEGGKQHQHQHGKFARSRTRVLLREDFGWCRALVCDCWGSLQRWRRDRRARRRRRRRGRAGRAAGEPCRDRTRPGRRPRGRDRRVWGGGGQRHQGAEEEEEGSAEETIATCCVSTRTMRPDSRSRPPSCLWWASASSASWPPSMSSASFTTTDPVAHQLKNEVYIFHLKKHYSFSARAVVSSTLWKRERDRETERDLAS